MELGAMGGARRAKFFPTDHLSTVLLSEYGGIFSKYDKRYFYSCFYESREIKMV